MATHRAYLTLILDAIQGIRDVVGEAPFDQYQRNRAMRRVAERELEIISVASRQLPQTLKELSPGVPWRAIADIGDKLRNDCFHIEDATVWSTARFELDLLERVCRDELARIGGDDYTSTTSAGSKAGFSPP